MIVYKKWLQRDRRGIREWRMEGWFLFGFIPLLKRDLDIRGRVGAVM